MVEKKEDFFTTKIKEAASFPHVYEPPRLIEDEKERAMAVKMIKTIDTLTASDEKKNKVKQLYV